MPWRAWSQRRSLARAAYGTEIGRETISRVTDAVLEHVLAWRTKLLENAYSIGYSTQC